MIFTVVIDVAWVFIGAHTAIIIGVVHHASYIGALRPTHVGRGLAAIYPALIGCKLRAS